MPSKKAGDASRFALSPHAVRILYQLQCDRAAARVDISESCDLSATTVTAVTGSLLEQGLIVEAETGEEVRGRGRPRVLLSLEPSALMFIGIMVGRTSIDLAIVDFSGKQISTSTSKSHVRRHDPIALAGQLADLVHNFLDESDVNIDGVAGIGIGLPGFINNSSGVVHWSPVLSEIDVELQALVQERVNCPISIDNDANLATLAERWYGKGVGQDNFLVVVVESGVGLGAFINGGLLRGARGVAGEFGHTKIVPDGALCVCGKRGCLSAYVSDLALIKEGLTLTKRKVDENLNLSDEVQALARRARAGDLELQRIFHHAGDRLGLGISNLINVLNPTKIILSGVKIHHFDLLQDSVEAAIERSVVLPERGQNKLDVSIWKDDLWTLGAAALALENWFNKVKTVA